MTHDLVPTGDRPAHETKPEIEVTPEMIEAGVAELCFYNPEFEDRENTTIRIFRAMAAAAYKDIQL